MQTRESGGSAKRAPGEAMSIIMDEPGLTIVRHGGTLKFEADSLRLRYWELEDLLDTIGYEIAESHLGNDLWERGTLTERNILAT